VVGELLAKGFRPDVDRCIHLSGIIDQEAITRLIPRIVQLRLESSDPITLFIDSNGGAVLDADILYDLVSQSDLDNQKCQLITVAVRRAQSAAAFLLARGAYAVAYPTAVIHFHGLRHQAAVVTTEKAAELSAALQSHNDSYALTLARSVIGRFFWLILTFQTELPKIESPDFISGLSKWLEGKLSKPNANLVKRAYAKWQEAEELSSYVFKKIRLKKNPTNGEMDVAVLKMILDYEVKTKPKNWEITPEGFDQIKRDFYQFHDYHWGVHKAAFSDRAMPLLRLLLPPEKLQELYAIPEADLKGREVFLKGNVEPFALPIWYFILSLCRLLYEGENPLRVDEAYWLGLVDEVMGSDLPCMRVLHEEAGKQKAADQSQS